MISRRYIAFLFVLMSVLPAAAQVTEPLDTLQRDGEFAIQNARDSALPLPPQDGRPAHLYRMNYWISGGFSAAATVANVFSINRIRDKSDITAAELAGLNPEAFNGFESWALRMDPYRTGRLDKSSDYLLQGIIAATATLGFDKAIRKDALRLFMMYYETHAVTFTIYNFSFFGPTFQNKYRPVTYYTELPDEVRRDGNNKNSMYSGHTASAAASTFFMAKVFNDYHPEFSFGRKYLIYTLAAIPPLVEGYYRMAALKHFPADVLIGLVIGATCGVVVPEMHRYKRQAIKVGVAATPVGPGICLSWRPGARSGD